MRNYTRFLLTLIMLALWSLPTPADEAGPPSPDTSAIIPPTPCVSWRTAATYLIARAPQGAWIDGHFSGDVAGKLISFINRTPPIWDGDAITVIVARGQPFVLALVGTRSACLNIAHIVRIPEKIYRDIAGYGA